MSIDIQAQLQAAWHLSELPLVPEKPHRCEQHIDPGDWRDEPASRRTGWIRTTCQRCGGFVGYRRTNDERERKYLDDRDKGV